MRCDELIARLDLGGPPGLEPRHREHARACASCGAAVRAAEIAEARLRATPPSPREGFTASVMERVEATERARRRLAESPRPSLWARWWHAVAAEPVALVALAVAPAPLLLPLVAPDMATSLAAFLRDAVAAWIASARSSGWFQWPGASADPLARGTLAAVLLSMVMLGLFFGLQWAGEVFGGSATSASRAHRASTSRRRPS